MQGGCRQTKWDVSVFHRQTDRRADFLFWTFPRKRLSKGRFKSFRFLSLKVVNMIAVLSTSVVNETEFRPHSPAVRHLLDGCHRLMRTPHWETREELYFDSPDCVK